MAQELPIFKATKYDSTAVKGCFFLAAKDNLIIMDKDANIVYYKPIEDVLDFTLEQNGKMIVASMANTFEMDSTFYMKDTFACKNEIGHDQHDRIILPKNHILLMGKERLKIDLTNYPEWTRLAKHYSPVLPTAVIQELDAERNVIFEWRAKDHFLLSDVDTFFISHDFSPEWTHSNALELDEDGNILLSSRNLNEITKINRSNGSIIWRFGGKNNEFKFVNCPVPFYGQHNIRKLANGHFTLFDNGDNIVPHGARAMEFELDEVNKIATLVWSYTYDKNMSSKGRGNVQRLTDGNTLINFGDPSCGNVSFCTVNSRGEKILEVSCFSPNSYRVTNYPSLPFHLNRPQISCFDSAGVKYLGAGVGYKSYKWNTGDTTRIIKITHAGSYSVFVPYGEGGFISSEKFTIGDIEKH